LSAVDGTSEEQQTERKSQIREKLATIFDLQQQRRTREIAKIEERLGKLKDVLKKRETAKDSIVDRRLETLTGGVDELGWEESLPGPNYSQPGFVPTLPITSNVPQAGTTIPGQPLLHEPTALPPPVAVPGPPGPSAGLPSALPPATPAPPVAPVPAAAPRR
jgi:hypothetical protein